MKANSHGKMKKKIVKAVGVTTAVAILVPAVSMGEGAQAVQAASTQGTATKTESVFVNADTSGKTEKETVSDWLHDDTSGAVVVDQSQLQSITNVKGNEKPQIDGNTVTWNLSGNDLYYQGKTDKALPVSMTLQYFLDGKAIAPSELAGKSGRFELKIRFENHDGHAVSIGGKSRTVYTPFACVAALNLPAKYFSNVTTNFGKVISDGSNQAVSFIGFPGLKESFDMLDLSSLNLPEELDVTADAQNFTLGPVMMVATPVPDMDSLKNTNDLSDLSGKLSQLINAGLQLKDATGTLNAGEQAFASGVGQLFAGISTAGSSFDQIVAGANTLNNSVNGTQNGISQLISGSQTLASGAGQVSGGLAQLMEQFQATGKGDTLKDGIDQVNGGAQQLNQGLGTMQSQLPSTAEVQQIIQGVSSLTGQLGQADTLNSSTSDYVTATNQVIYNMVSTNLTTMKGAIAAALQQAGKTDPAEIAAITGNVYQAVVQQELAGIAAQANTCLSSGDSATQQAAAVPINMYDILNVIASDTDQVKDEASFEDAMEDADNPYFFKSGDSAASALVKTINGNNVVAGGRTLKTAIAGLAKTVKDNGSLLTQSQSLLSNMPTLIAGVNQLHTGAAALANGTAALDAQTTAGGTLHDSVAALAAGAQQVSSGAQSLASGASGLTTLQNGIGTLTGALGQFRTGLAAIQNGGSALNSNAKKLTDGTSALNAGMNQFWDQGLGKLQSIDTDKMSQALAVKDEMIQLADQYTNFTGTGKGISSNVKFIVKTDEIKPQAKAAAGAGSGSSGRSENFWQKIGDWFRNLFRAD